MAYHNAARIRGAAVWAVVTLGVAGVFDLALPALGGGGPAGSEFADLLVQGCAGAALAAAGWLWLVTTDVVLAVLRRRTARLARGRRPGPLRTAVLAACGVIALSGPAAAVDHPASTAVSADREPGPAGHDTDTLAPGRLAGLPLPDRPTGSALAPPDPAVVRVRSGDSLWAIAERRLGPDASVVEITAYGHRIYDRNATVIGPDPDLILPGQLLILPTSHPHFPTR